VILLDIQDLIATFRERGYSVTPQRLAICNFILKRKDHPTADHIYQELKKEYPTISLGTIYKTLHLLKQFGLIQELGFNEGSIRYDPDIEAHVNLVCAKCGKIQDYKSESVSKFWSIITSELDFKPKGQRIDIYYECNDCKQKD